MDLSPLRSNLVRPEVFSYTLSSILPINFSLSLSARLISRITKYFTFETIIQILLTCMNCNYSNGYLIDKVLRSHIKQPLSIKLRMCIGNASPTRLSSRMQISPYHY